jgi:hypothetical protein
MPNLQPLALATTKFLAAAITTTRCAAQVSQTYPPELDGFFVVVFFSCLAYLPLGLIKTEREGHRHGVKYGLLQHFNQASQVCY